MKPVKRTAVLFWVIFMGFVSSSNAETSSGVAPQGTRERKFQRGLLNVAFAPVELSQSMAEAKNVKGDEFPSVLSMGIPRGVWRGSLRALTGIYEILTFPFAAPPDYQPVIRPEFPLEHLGLMQESPASPEAN